MILCNEQQYIKKGFAAKMFFIACQLARAYLETALCLLCRVAIHSLKRTVHQTKITVR
jgi:hypothetical protein